MTSIRHSSLFRWLGRRWRWASVAILLIAGAGLLTRASSLHAAPLSGGQGNPPFQKLAVYQGIIALAPGANQALQLGNFNTTYNAIEIESLGSPTLRPKTSVVTIAPQNSTAEGAEIRLLPSSGSYPEWHLDSYTDTLGTGTLTDDLTYGRIFTGTEKLRFGPSGDTHIIGRLCFGSSVSPADCLNQWLTFASSGNQNLDSILSYGNRGRLGLSVGDFNYGVVTARKAPWNGYDPSLNAITARSAVPFGSGNGSAFYAENDLGFAGVLIGKVGVVADNVAVPAFGAETQLRVAGSVPKSAGAILDVVNQNSQGFAARIRGTVDITGSGAGTASATEAEAVLLLRNSSAIGTTLKVLGRYGNLASVAYGGNVSGAGNTSYAVYGEMGAASAGASSYAGYFKGHSLVGGILNVRPYGGTEPWGLKFGSDARLKKTIELQVCRVDNDVCYGRYVQTLNGSNRPAATYCYDDDLSYKCDKLVYSGATQVHELR